MPHAIERPGPELARPGKPQEMPAAKSITGQPTIYLLRHGSVSPEGGSEMGDKKIIRGSRMDVPLSPKGVNEAKMTGQALAGANIGALYSSDLKRSTQSADAVGSALGMKPQVDPGLRPWDMGKLSGHPLGEIRQQLIELQKNPKSTQYGNEPFEDYYNRWGEALKQHMQEAEGANKPIALMTHSRNLLSVEPILSGKKANQMTDHEIPEIPTGITYKEDMTHTGAVSRLTKGPQGWQLEEGSQERAG